MAGKTESGRERVAEREGKRRGSKGRGGREGEGPGPEIFRPRTAPGSQFQVQDCFIPNSPIHMVTVTQFRSISMLAGFCRHLVGTTLRSVCNSVVTYVRFFGMSDVSDEQIGSGREL